MNKQRRSASFALILFAFLSLFVSRGAARAATGVQTSNRTESVSAYPVRVLIPSIKLDSPIEAVGLNGKGEMAVPSGKTKNVGWYAAGTVPGKVGSAVLDAHVFAAFAKLHKVKAGSSIYVVMSDGTRLRFVVASAHTYALSRLSPVTLFGNSGTRTLNLITCAGQLTADHSTYDHRLVVNTIFAGEA